MQVSQPRQCPKCRGIPCYFKEVWTNHGIEFDVDDDGRIADEGYKQDGVPHHVEAYCGACDHLWRLRGVTQITELRNRP